MQQQIIPAAKGWSIPIISNDNVPVLIKMPVIAWSIGDDGVTPITLFGPQKNKAPEWDDPTAQRNREKT